jgi:HAD superfamily hydrolase (TIGR01509 family)
MNSLDVAATIHRILRPALSLGQCQKIMRDDLIVRFSGEIHPMPGAVDLVRRLKKTKPMAIASGSPLIAIERATVHLAIRDCFDHLITSESVPRGKPHPDVFLAAARTLNTAPANCLVFEDSLIGVRAAQAAGTKCLSIPSSSHQEIAAIATRVYASLADISDEELKRET